MTNQMPMGMPPFMMEEPKENPELKLSHAERMKLAEERAAKVHLFSNMNDAVRHHQETIMPILIEEKYQVPLVCLISSHSPLMEPWAPKVERYFATTYNENNNSYMQDLLYAITDHEFTISNILLGDADNDRTPRAFSYIPRNIVEYNHMFVQLCVVAVIRDKQGRYLLLSNHANSDGRVKDQTSFIQGHVEVSEDINFMSAHDYLVREAIREINEEVAGITLPETSEILVSALFYDNRTQIGSEHMSALVTIEVEDLTTVVTNEDDKHDILVVNGDDFAAIKNPDNIVEAVLNEGLLD